MQLNLTGHHIDISAALREYVDSKLRRLERHFDNLINVHVVLTVEKASHRAEATVQVSGGQIFADAADGDMYAAIDALADKLDRQVRRHKEKLSDHHRDKSGLKSRA